MHPLLKLLRIIIFFVFAWAVIIGGSFGVFVFVRDILTNQNVVIASITTIIFLFVAIAIGERFAEMVNCLLARLSGMEPPACSSGKVVEENRNTAGE